MSIDVTQVKIQLPSFRFLDFQGCQKWISDILNFDSSHDEKNQNQGYHRLVLKERMGWISSHSPF